MFYVETHPFMETRLLCIFAAVTNASMNTGGYKCAFDRASIPLAIFPEGTL